MTANDVTPPRAGLLRRWPITTLFGVSGVTALGLVLSVGADAPVEPDYEEAVALAATPEADSRDDAAAPEVIERAAPSRDEEAAGAKVAEKAETADGADAPAPASKSGLYAMKASEDARAVAGEAGILGVHGGAFSVGSDDADVWGGLTGEEVGEAYGVGGLGLIGTGRGGGGVGSGYGRGHGVGFGEAGSTRSGRFEPAGSFDKTVQARVLTAGVVDDNADADGYTEAMTRLAGARGSIGLTDAMINMTAPSYRHTTRPRALDVALVIDTTGSMGDELEYLKVELREIAREIAETNPGVSQRWGLVAYRDHGDAYVTHTEDFRDIDSFVERLGRQSAGGGGDYPEAMDEAALASAQLSWRADSSTARMVFLVADAPSHAGQAAQRFARAVEQHRDAKTAIYPVASSGVRDEAEAQMRYAAKVTGGQYIFLTDHSGVGSAHAKPHVDKFEVETLHDVMERMISLELGGESRTIVTELPPPPPPAVTPTATVTRVVVAPPMQPRSQGILDVLRDMIRANPLLSLGVSLAFFAGMVVDTWAYRRRRRLEALARRSR